MSLYKEYPSNLKTGVIRLSPTYDGFWPTKEGIQLWIVKDTHGIFDSNINRKSHGSRNEVICHSFFIYHWRLFWKN